MDSPSTAPRPTGSGSSAPRLGTGSDYAIAFVDSEKQVFDGAKTYKIEIPADVPVNPGLTFPYPDFS